MVSVKSGMAATPLPSPAAGRGDEEDAGVGDGDERGEPRLQRPNLASWRRARTTGRRKQSEACGERGAEEAKQRLWQARETEWERYFLFGKTTSGRFFYLGRRRPDGWTSSPYHFHLNIYACVLH